MWPPRKRQETLDRAPNRLQAGPAIPCVARVQSIYRGLIPQNAIHRKRRMRLSHGRAAAPPPQRPTTPRGACTTLLSRSSASSRLEDCALSDRDRGTHSLACSAHRLTDPSGACKNSPMWGARPVRWARAEFAEYIFGGASASTSACWRCVVPCVRLRDRPWSVCVLYDRPKSVCAPDHRCHGHRTTDPKPFRASGILFPVRAACGRSDQLGPLRQWTKVFECCSRFRRDRTVQGHRGLRAW